MAATTTTPTPPPVPSLLLNTSFLITRLTPLFSLTRSRLAHYAHEFRDIVKGDVLRGVRTTALSVDKAKNSLVGSCEWTFEDLVSARESQCLVIRLSWEDGSLFTAILVPDFVAPDNNTTLGKRKRGAPGGAAGAEGFTSLPLMLSRGSYVVREQLMTYLSTRFDCRAAEVFLPARLLEECLQGYLERCFSGDQSSQRAGDRSIRILDIMFTVPETKDGKVKGALRKITISLPAQDIQEMYQRSPTMMESLTKHVVASTAINLEQLTVSRIACAGLVLDSSGRMKIFENAGIQGMEFILGKVVEFVAKDILPV